MDDPSPSPETLRELGVKAVEHLELGALPKAGTVAILGRPSEMDGVGKGIAEALELRGNRVWIGCQWLESIRLPTGQHPSAYVISQEYSDEPAADVAMAIMVQTTLFNPAIAATLLLWALDNVPTKRFGLVSLLADQSAIDDLQESVSFATTTPLDVSVGYAIDENERPGDAEYRTIHELISDGETQRDDRKFMPGIIATRRKLRRENRAEPSNGPGRGR